MGQSVSKVFAMLALGHLGSMATIQKERCGSTTQKSQYRMGIRRFSVQLIKVTMHKIVCTGD